MKKILIIAICGLTFTGNALAQQYEYGTPEPVKEKTGAGKTRFGIFIAPAMSWMKPASNKSDDKLYLLDGKGSKMGFSWGLMVDHFFDDNYGISTGFQLTSMGGNIDAELNTAVPAPTTNNLVRSANFEYKLRYLEIPFGLKLLSDNLGSGLRVYGQLGLCAGITIGKKATFDVTYTDTNSTGAIVNKTVSGEGEKIQGTGVAPLLLQMNLGGGIEYPITSKMRITAGIYFNNGFVPDVTNPKEYDLGYKGKFSDGNTRLNNFGLRIGVFF